jgi:hypothetical protein
MAARSRAWRFKLLLAFALAVVVGWSVLWFLAATIVDRQIHKAQMAAVDAGAMAECVGRSVTGFPFRIEVRCADGSRAASPGGAVTIGGATLAALVYDPDQVIAEIAGPLTIASVGGPEMRAEWSLAHASARLDFDAMALERFDAEVKEATFTVGSHPPVAIGEVDAHLRRDPEAPTDLGLAIRFQDVIPVVGGEPVSLALRGRLGEGAALLAGRPEELLAAVASGGVPFIVETATLESGEMLLEATGELTLGADGLIDGMLDLVIAGAEETLPYFDGITPGASKGVKEIIKNVLKFAPETEVGDRMGKKVSLVINDGRVKAGIVPLFTVPPVIVAQH